MFSIISLIRNFYWRFFVSPEKYLRHIGVNIGEDCFIATRNMAEEPYLITIGNHVQLTQGVAIHTHGGANVIRREYPDFDIFGKVVIEDWAYVGAFSQIMPGVTVGEGAIVAAGSIVTKSVLPHTVVGGNPAKYICSTQNYLERNLKYNLHCKGMTKEEKKKYLSSLTDEKFLKK